MIDSTPLRAWTSGCWWGFGSLVGLRLGRAHISAQYELPSALALLGSQPPRPHRAWNQSSSVLSLKLWE